MCCLEVALAFIGAWVAISRVAPTEFPDHRETILVFAGGTLPIALMIFPGLAWLAFHRHSDAIIWPLLWSPVLWALAMLAAA